MSELRAGYVPGSGVAVVGAEALVLLPGDVEPRLVRAVHAALVPGAGVPDVLQVLTGEFATSLSRIPPFAVAVVSGRGVHAVARGAAEVRVTAPDGVEPVSGEGVSTWTERFVAGATGVELVVAGEVRVDDDAVWPLAGGIVHADAVRSSGPADSSPTATGAGIASAAATAAGAAAETATTSAQPAGTAAAAAKAASKPAGSAGASSDRASYEADADERRAPLLSREPGRTGEPEPEPEPEQPGSGPGTEARPEAEAVPGPVPDPEPAPGSLDEPAVASEETVVPTETVLPTETVIPADDDAFDHLWGSTVLRPVEEAAVRPDERDPDDDPLPAPSPTPRPTEPQQPMDRAPAAPAPGAPARAAAAPGASTASASAPQAAESAAPAAPAAPATPSGPADAAAAPNAAGPADPATPAAPATPATEERGASWVPPFTIDAPTPGGEAPVAPSASNSGEATDAAPGTRSEAPSAASVDPPPGAPVDPPSGAPGDAASGPLGDHDGHTVLRGQPAVVVPEPAAPLAPGGQIGWVRLSTGEELPLDRPVVLGRKPRVSRVGGAAVPRLVTVPSPDQDISRSHLEIRLEGVSVLVVDLGSTNGSTLLRTGQLPVRLHPHEAVLVVEGDVVDIGEGVTVTFEGLS